MSKFDVNDDGKVDYRDILAAALKVLDLDGDGEVTLKDAIRGASVMGASAGAAATAGYISEPATAVMPLFPGTYFFKISL